MPELTRRRNPESPQECWHIHYGDVHAGTIAIRAGIPHDEDPWEWHCGFYPGSHPRECTSGTAVTFDQARADFEAAWLRAFWPAHTPPALGRRFGRQRRAMPDLIAMVS